MGLTRQEMFSRLQLIRITEPVATAAMEAGEDHAWRTGRDNDPHGRPWHTSFHASGFPGTNELACPRKALYTMMNVPNDKPFTPRSRMFMETGKAIENVLVSGFYYQGILLSPPPWEPVQLGFSDPDVWLTGNADAVILHPKLGRPHVIECKARQQKVLDEMRVGLRGPDEGHVVQAKTYVAYMHELSKQLWPRLDPVRDGTIYYISMDDPSITAEFLVDYDPKFKAAGVEKLLQWKQWFEDDLLPSYEAIPDMEIPKGRSKHPMGWRWTYPPCNWCDHGQVCRKDFKEKVVKLSKSYAIGHAKALNEDYDYDTMRAAVFAAWEASDA